MRTKEIEGLKITGWRCDGLVIGQVGLSANDIMAHLGINCRGKEMDSIKIKIVAEFPERKIEITESELEYAFNYCVGGDIFHRPKWLTALKEKLFKEKL
jgi:hypothetical protein